MPGPPNRNDPQSRTDPHHRSGLGHHPRNRTGSPDRIGGPIASPLPNPSIAPNQNPNGPRRPTATQSPNPTRSANPTASPNRTSHARHPTDQQSPNRTTNPPPAQSHGTTANPAPGSNATPGPSRTPNADYPNRIVERPPPVSNIERSPPEPEPERRPSEPDDERDLERPVRAPLRPRSSADRSARHRRAGSAPVRRRAAQRLPMLLDLVRGRRPFHRQHPAADVGERQAPAGEPVQRSHRASGDDVGAMQRPTCSSARPRTTVTWSVSPSAATASSRKAVRRASGSTRMTEISGLATASTIPGRPAPEPTSMTVAPGEISSPTTAQLSRCRSQSRGASRGPISPRRTPRSRAEPRRTTARPRRSPKTASAASRSLPGTRHSRGPDHDPPVGLDALGLALPRRRWR